MQQQTFSKEQVDLEELGPIMQINQFTNSLFDHSIPWFYLLDYTSGKYLVISRSVNVMLGYDPSYFMQEGVAVVSEQYHAAHLKLFNEEIFPDRLDILKNIPYQEHPKYIFSYNFQFKNRKGEYVNLLQRNCFIRSDKNGNPLMSFGIILNINHYKEDNPIIQVVEKVDNSSNWEEAKPILKKAYYLYKEHSLFTRRERELLPYLAEGLNSREIADKLFISEYTVVNHRRNMMTKSNTKNMAELISYAIRQQML